jgi:ATP-binding cassette, subfamily B, bacterial CvaB/MchF/RaxB
VTMTAGGPWKIQQVYQRESAECFLACVAMLVMRTDHRWSLPLLRIAAPPSSRGSSVADGVSVLKSIGLDAYAARVDLDDFDSLDEPAILHWNFDHFVVYAGRSGSHYLINDPALGPRRVDPVEFSESFTGVLIVAEGTVNAPPEGGAKRELRLRDLFVFDRKYGALISEVVALTLCAQIAVLAMPLIMSRIIGDGIALNDDMLEMAFYGVGAYLAIAVYSVICSTLKEWAIVRVNQQLEARMSKDVFERIFSHSIGFIRRRNPSDLASRFDSVSAVGLLFSQGIVAAAFDILTLIVSCAALMLLAPKVAIITICGAIAYAALRIMAMRWTIPLTENLLLSESRLKSHTLETIKAHHVLVGADAIGYRLGSWLSLFHAKLSYARRMALLHGAINAVRGGVPAIELSIVLLIGVTLIAKGEITVGALVALLAYRQRLFDVASGVADRYSSWREIRVHVDRIGDVWETDTAYRPGVDASQEPLVSLTDISFRYAGEASPCIEGISFDIAKGDMIAIVGPTGSGKSTLLSIAAGHEAPTSGEVRLSTALTGDNAVAIVFQDDVVLDATIMDNITMGRTDIDPTEVERALKGASLLDEVMRMPSGLNSIVGPGGAFLSGGQRQRLTIARALLSRPKLLVLDEATSNLDVPTERSVMASLLQHADAVLYAAHRPDAIARATRIIKVEKHASSCVSIAEVA